MLFTSEDQQNQKLQHYRVDWLFLKENKDFKSGWSDKYSKGHLISCDLIQVG